MKKIMIIAFLWIGMHLNLFSQPIFLKEIPESSKSLFEGNGNLYFFAGDSLWKSDGTVAGTVFVKKIGETPIAYPKNSNALSINGASIFYTQDSPSTIGVWRTGGTSATTLKIRSFNSISPITSYQSNLYFAADDGSTGGELWKLSSTFSFSLVKDINPGSGSSLSSGLFNNSIYITPCVISNNVLYFTASNLTTGTDVWKTNGTGSGTTIVKDLPYYSYLLNEVNGTIFIGTNYIDNNQWEYNISELWKSNGTSAGTTLVKKFSINGDSHGLSHGRPFKNKLAFFLEYEYGTLLYLSDGTDAGTILVRQYIPYWYGGVAYTYTINDALIITEGYETIVSVINRSDGTPEGSTQIAEYNDYFTQGTVEFVQVKEKLIYNDADQEYPDTRSEEFDQLYETSGYPGKGSVRKTKDIYPNGNSYPNSRNLTEVNGTLFFTTQASGSSYPTGKFKLWVYNPDKPNTNVPYFTLVNADTDKDIGFIREGDTLFRPAGGNINIRYNSVSTIGSVILKVNDVPRRTENTAPYALAGDNNGDYSPWTTTPGQYKITGVAYSGSGGTGIQGTTTSVNFLLKEFIPNAPPVANAGPDITIPYSPGILKVAGSYTDPNEGYVARWWTAVSSPYPECIPGNCPDYYSGIGDTLILYNPIPGEYIFRYIAQDREDLTSIDEVKITITGQGVISFSLMNADTDQEIKYSLYDGAVIDLAYLSSSINFRANAAPSSIGSVRFNYDGTIRTENVAPYAYFGDTNGDYNPGALTVGSHILSAWPYTGSNATGSQGVGLTYHFTVINSAARMGSTETMQVNAYPNPSSDKINISIPESGDGTLSISIYNSQGSLVTNLFEGTYQKIEMVWNVADLPDGIYFCKVNTSAGTKVEKLVVKR
ncbi:MAG: T9SS type A sorting domain-containing protein [Sporocytophaga sp.]|uniref:T9SS type A sorting domain-containing protein n=1 Tax=Sporocytophaga sp. TaxID=2231183 RepID=UPI001B1C0902|nr:T9SS type A sorting domain-containing protein [Sporocytophaga sp.]MBO9699030.1 T9SS type A sorting domain-containing protein [Sporocytophaga sp.]